MLDDGWLPRREDQIARLRVVVERDVVRAVRQLAQRRDVAVAQVELVLGDPHLAAHKQVGRDRGAVVEDFDKRLPHTGIHDRVVRDRGARGVDPASINPYRARMSSSRVIGASDHGEMRAQRLLSTRRQVADEHKDQADIVTVLGREVGVEVPPLHAAIQVRQIIHHWVDRGFGQIPHHLANLPLTVTARAQYVPQIA